MQQQDNHEYPFLYQRQTCHQVQPNLATFFFQAEDGIRARNVTGVQTCALPIYLLPAVMVLVVVDLLVYSANQYWLTAPPRSALTDTTGMATAVAAHTGSSGRFAIYDPDQSDTAALDDLGQPDLNVLRRLSSVQGYGSVVSGDYDRATGSHQQSDLSVTALAGTTFDDLNLTTLVTRPGYFTEPPGSTVAPTGPVPVAVPAGGQHAWYLGSPRRPTGVSIHVRVDPGCPLPAGGLGL